MTTSGTTTFELDVAEIIEEAYERIGIEVRGAYQVKSARRSLNLILQELANRQVNLWKLAEVTVSLVQGTSSYVLDAEIMDVQMAVLRRNSIDTRMNRMARTVYQTRPNKATQSRPSQFFIDRVNPPVMYLYLTPENSTDEVVLQVMNRVEDVTASIQTLDIPNRFAPAIIAGLTYQLALKFKPDMITLGKQIFEEELGRALEEDRERASLFLKPAGVRI